MDTAYTLLDAFCITPYRWLPHSTAAFWLGTAIVSLYCVFLGKISMCAVYLWNRHYYVTLHKKMVRMHNISVAAIQHKDKASFTAANRWANEYFGKVFFAQAALFAVSLWPAPFALAWLQSRFTGLTIHVIPGLDYELGYAFVFITCYLIVRFGDAKIRTRIPLFNRIESMRQEDARLAEPITSWSPSDISSPVHRDK